MTLHSSTLWIRYDQIVFQVATKLFHHGERHKARSRDSFKKTWRKMHRAAGADGFESLAANPEKQVGHL